MEKKEYFVKELIVIDKSDIDKMIGARMIVLASGIKKGLSPEAIRTHEAGIAALEWVLSLSKPAETVKYTEEDVLKAYDIGYDDRDKDIGHGSNIPYLKETLKFINQ